MTRLALTGAAGNVGRVLLDAFREEDALDVIPFTHSAHDDMDATRLDVTDPDDVAEKLGAFDVVVHLAGASSPDADWETVSETNVQGTKHVLDAAVENGIDRVVFASSNHAVGTYNAAGDDPETVTLGAQETVPGDAPTAPDSFYGVSKAACENLTRYYAHRHDLEVVNLRIGWYMTENALREATGDDVDPGRDRFARAMWLSARDCADVHRKAATVDLPESPVTVNAVSRNDERFLTVTEAMRLLDYRPRDNAAETLDG
ncbi:NAD(P)-dependent oxidoreductase [Halorubellus sp. JP-L1]|uniref:NAD-dependent epimerase/dehydratase family protein n=1 Tax=Halorubellus sp. JP-L1 TaxID=2715753 RepID=UPI001407C4FD|nr:NAD(P)-dependent oxidoreductase [Halorubellus sp. JP-L1]NHN41164.1 NAD(P)-dependent oxidoreductase [Halorubellus sp. JP-L1]